jgi:hypothetical protein
MNIKEILKSARANDIDISVSGNNLQIKSEKPGVPPALLEAIKRNKAEIIAYLKEQMVDTGRFQSILITTADMDTKPVQRSRYRL